MNNDLKKLLKEKAESKKKKKSELIAVRLPIDVYDGVKDLCSSTGLNQSEIIVQALRSSLGIKEK